MTDGPQWTEQQTFDAVTTLLGQRLAEKGLLAEVLGDMSAEERLLVEEAFDRHGAHMRELGRPGW